MVRILMIALALWTSSCSVIKVSTNEEIDIYRKFGFINVVGIPDAGAYVDLNFIGIGVSDNDFILGYKSSKNVVMPNDSCAVFIDKKSVVDSAVLSYLRNIDCIFIYSHGEFSNE